jgi:hypothetical protein
MRECGSAQLRSSRSLTEVTMVVASSLQGAGGPRWTERSWAAQCERIGRGYLARAPRVTALSQAARNPGTCRYGH